MSVLRHCGRVLLALVFLASLFALVAWLLLRGSLPQLDGRMRASGLHGAVTISREDHGVPTIEGESRDDVAYATGFAHAQDRFFQMDMLRRAGAGELAELLGASMLSVDKERRLHLARVRATELLAALAPAERQLLERYAAGVNDGLESLKVRPFEYLFLRSTPQPWTPVDSLLVIWSMYFELQQYQQARALSLAWFRQHTTPAQFDYFFPPATSYDAPLDAPGITLPSVEPPKQAPQWLGRAEGRPAGLAVEARLVPMVGSNSWAIAGSRSDSGSAILTNDMHLTLGLPNAWYRMVLSYLAPDRTRRHVAGVTLPGLPYVVAGSNGRVAWGLTNSYCECLRLVPLEADPADVSRLRTPQGWERVRLSHQRIEVRGGPTTLVDVRQTSIGPVVEVEQRSYAVQWVANRDGAVNLRFADLEAASNVDAALSAASASGIPAQNFIAGDVDGHIGWTIAGALPLRQAPAIGLLPPGEHPRIVDPEDGQLWSANSRQLAGPGAALIGDGGADIGARASQIRRRLNELPQNASQQKVAEIALDDEAMFLAPWRERLLRVLDDQAVAGQPERAEFRRLVQTGWTGHADVDSVGYTLVRQYFYAIYYRLFGSVNDTLRGLSSKATFNVTTPRWSVPVARLIDEAPDHWLPDGQTWRELQLAAVDDAITALTVRGESLASARWGMRNRANILHRFARAFPWLAGLLAAPGQPQAGDDYMPRVAMPSFGQSMRLAVTPGREAQGQLVMPGGQSGHPLSPYFLADQRDWLEAHGSPLLPAPGVHALNLVPQ